MNKIFSFFSTIIICVSPITMNAQQNPIATLTVDAGNYDRYDTPVGVIVEELMNRSDMENLSLYEVSGEKRIPVMCQVEQGTAGKIWWIMDGYTPAGTTRNFEIVSEKELVNEGTVKVVQDSSVFRIFKSQKEVLNYFYATYPAPEGADNLYSRSGFIHPVYSPSGNVLTRIQPPDHLHHYGIWNPWTKVKFQNRNHPEPMRVWPEDANNGRGDMFFEFCPIRDKDWILIPGKKYILKYRLLVYDGEISTQLAKDLWTGFAYPPDVKIIYNKITD